jgi:hypothetical protein
MVWVGLDEKITGAVDAQLKHFYFVGGYALGTLVLRDPAEFTPKRNGEM